VGVSLVAADLVAGVGADAHHVEGIEAHLGAGNVLADGLLSIETARIDWRRSPSSAKNRCSVALLRPFATHTIWPLSWSATTVR
jgi:hypothetical protein